ncbi:MAG: NAD-dependent deacylase [Chloroflexi bacterium]|nr:NAD-dependent deacylase [Chloroflexota bacterium]
MTHERDVQRAADLLRAANHVVALTGAGMSTPSGLPDFRSPHSGLWEKDDPMVVASIYGFRVNPRAFYDWLRPLVMTMRQAQPNPAHLALARLERAGQLAAIITQNIDGLHQSAGSQRVLELHGSMRTASCTRCGRGISGEQLAARLLQSEDVPRCEKCGGILKPDVVLFGELLPQWVLLEAQGEAEKCDVMLVVGSSLTVTPAADLPFTARQHGAEIIIVNAQPTYMDAHSAVVIHDDLATVVPQIVDLAM